MLIDDLNQLIVSIEVDFYQRLINGDMKKARASSDYITSLILEIQKNLVQKIKMTTDPDIVGGLVSINNDLRENFTKWKALVDEDLKGISGKDFQEDPKSWYELLKDTFQKPTDQLLIVVTRLCALINKLERLNTEEYIEGIPTEHYNEIKFGRKVYANNLKIINGVEKKICERISIGDFNNRKITGKIQSGPWKDCLHAYLPMPLGDHRIVYNIDKKKVIFLAIGTHKGLGIS